MHVPWLAKAFLFSAILAIVCVGAGGYVFLNSNSGSTPAMLSAIVLLGGGPVVFGGFFTWQIVKHLRQGRARKAASHRRPNSAAHAPGRPPAHRPPARH